MYANIINKEHSMDQNVYTFILQDLRMFWQNKAIHFK